MKEPPERITLALRPKAADPAAPKPPPSHGPPAAPLPPGVDAAVYAEVKQAARTYDYLLRFGEPIEFWEAVRLARSRRGISEAGDGTEEAGAGLADELQVIRRQLSPMVQDLRRYIARLTDIPPKGEQLEFAMGFLLASSREHQAVAKWLAESDKHLDKAASKLRSLATIAAPYIEILRPWSLDGPKEPLAAAAPSAAAPASPAPNAPATKPAAAAPAAAAAAAGAAVAIDPEALENFRRAIWCRRIFAETHLPAAFWELLLFNTVERILCKGKLAAIQLAYKEKRTADFHEETRSLHSRLIPLRARQAPWIEALLEFLRALPGAPKDAGLLDLALGFAVVEPGAPDRARRWIANPEASAREASAALAGHVAQANAYQAALKKPVA